MTMFLCYDLKGIQSFVFRVPKLRYIVGGSALIDRFDRDFVGALDVPGSERLFSGGGRGAFRCEDAKVAARLEDRLTREAHGIGADISIGLAPDLSEAAHVADRFFPCLLEGESIDGHPCAASGLFPVPTGGIHPTMQKRLFSRGEKPKRRYELEFLGGWGNGADAVAGVEVAGLPEGTEIDFFHDVSPDGESIDPALMGEPVDQERQQLALAAAVSLGARNRWAVIAMDGNDIGSQFAHQHRRDASAAELADWIAASSQCLDQASRRACREGLQAVVDEWQVVDGAVQGATFRADDGAVVILPVRPLLVGGDDVVVLCHVSHAFTFVKTVTRVFGEQTKAGNDTWKDAHGVPMWPATGGRLSISAGVLFAPVSLPLSSAIEMAQSLLASAKGEGRRRQAKSELLEPTPAMVDWEVVTGSMVEHPATTRQRDYRFRDEDIDEIVTLTRKPYDVHELAALERLADDYQAELPATVAFQAGASLRKAYWDRQVWVARLGKNQQRLAADLAEQKVWGTPHGRWTRVITDDVGERDTDVLDAMELVAERMRMSHRTVDS